MMARTEDDGQVRIQDFAQGESSLGGGGGTTDSALLGRMLCGVGTLG